MDINLTHLEKAVAKHPAIERIARFACFEEQPSMFEPEGSENYAEVFVDLVIDGETMSLRTRGREADMFIDVMRAAGELIDDVQGAFGLTMSEACDAVAEAVNASPLMTNSGLVVRRAAAAQRALADLGDALAQSSKGIVAVTASGLVSGIREADLDLLGHDTVVAALRAAAARGNSTIHSEE